MIQICYTYNILRTFSLIVWSIFVSIFSIFSCIDIFDFFVEKIGYISDIYQWYISMIYIMPTLPAGQSPIPLCCRMSSNERVIVTPSVLDIPEHGIMRWCKGFEIPLPQGYQAGVSNSVVRFTGSRGTMTCHSITGTGSHRQFPSLRNHLPL